jgi:transcriptional regulator with XRE-family HTH domain
MPTVRELRERKALTQNDLAERAGISRMTVISIEHGKKSPIASVRRKLAEALGAEPEHIAWPSSNGKAAGD